MEVFKCSQKIHFLVPTKMAAMNSKVKTVPKKKSKHKKKFKVVKDQKTTAKENTSIKEFADPCLLLLEV